MVTNIAEILNQLSDLNIYLFVEGGKLKTRAAKGVLSDDVIALIKDNKAELISYLLQQREGLDTLPPIEVSAVSSTPLSFAQQRLWMVDEIDGGSPQFNLLNCLRLTGELNIAAVEFSFTQIIERHQVLRTNIIVDKAKHGEDHVVKQVVREMSEFKVEKIDLSTFSESERERKTQFYTNQQTESVFDLSRDKMLRAQLLKMGSENHVLLVCIHHIASDGWSTSVLVNEFCELYTSFVTGKSANLPVLEVQYNDYAFWQREHLKGELLERKLNYWGKKLENIPLLHGLPLDHPRPRRQSYEGANHRMKLPVREVNAFNSLCKKNGATLFMGLQSVFAALLHRYSNETDIVMGTPVANRDQEEVASLIGFFVNTLVLRSDLSNDPNFEVLLKQSKDMLLSNYENQQVPFEHIVDHLNPERSLSHSPLFQIMIVLQNNNKEALTLPGLSLDSANLDGVNVAVQYDLILEINEDDDGLIFNWEYNSDLFSLATIDRMSNSFFHLIQGVLNDPKRSISSIELLSQEARTEALNSGRGSIVGFPKEMCLHELFESHAKQTPEATALIYASSDGFERSLTYETVNHQANQLAHYLRKHKKVVPGSLVGICLKRSPEMIVAVLAVLKSGAAYVPLDAEYPEARLKYIVADANLALVLSESSVANMSESIAACALCLDDSSVQAAIDKSAYENIDAKDVGVSSDCLAYVIYTSGSTGKPKGTLLSHMGLNNLSANQAKSFAVEMNSRVLQFASIAFDAATWEFVMSLSNGATLCIVDQQIFDSPQLLSSYVKKHGVTHATLPPAILSVLDLSSWNSVTTLIVAGEACAKKAADRWCKGRRFFNAYGPSETTVCATIGEYTGGKLHMGSALDNVSTYVLNEQQHPVPPNCIGELYIGGVGLAIGYLNRPDLTAERFIDNPFRDENIDPSTRLYRTGDLVRCLQDGSLEFIGRCDNQVKVRGFRVELGEIENVLNESGQVNESLVLAKTISGSSGLEKKLVSYIVPTDEVSDLLELSLADADLSEEQNNARIDYIETLRRSLRDSLPEYMVPSAFLLLSKFPLTANGKLDLHSLPSSSQLQLKARYVAPQTKTEVSLCNIWQSVLGIDGIGIEHNFFDVGGNSLMAMRLVSEINQAFQVDLPIKDIFEHQSIDSLAGFVEDLKLGQPSCEAPRISKVISEGALLTSYSQQRLWMLNKIDGSNSHYNLFEGLTLSGPLDYRALDRSFETIVERHESLRTTFGTQQNGEPFQVVRSTDAFRVQYHDLSQLELAERELDIAERVRNEPAISFDLSEDIMLRCSVLKLAEKEHILLVTVNHIASDGWSMSILVNEFCTLYKAYIEELINPLEDLDIQYSDYAQWQREWLAGEVLDRQLAYWEEQLADSPTVHSLPLDHARPQQQSFEGDVFCSRIDKQTTEKFIGLCQREGATLFMGLQALFAALLSRLGNTTDVIMGTSIANREQSEVADLIGFFVNSLVLRNDFSMQPNFRDLLGQSKEMLLSAYANQQVPFEQVVERLQPERNLSHSPLFQIMLVLQNNDKSELSLPGIDVSPAMQNTRGTVAKYELALDVNQSEDGLSLNWEYNSDLFEAQSIARMASCFDQLIAAVNLSPETNLSRIDILNEQENRLLGDWCQNVVEYPRELCVHELFEAQVAKTPEAVAMVFEDARGCQQKISYSQLNTRANQLAHFLVAEYEICPDDLVGVFVERSVEMFVSILAVLKAGGAYLPIDPDYPRERIQFMLRDATPRVVLTQRYLKDKTALNCIATLALDDDELNLELALRATTNIDVRELGVQSSHLAYVIYTSGSTGKPKGTLLVHSGLCNLALGQIEGFSVAPESRVLQFASISFDAATSEWAMALLSGARLYVIADELYRSPQALSLSVKRNAISHATLPPALLPVLDEFAWTSVTTLIVAGEACKHSMVERWSAGRTLINAYGPSENTVCATLGSYEDRKGFLDIGRPMQNVSVYVLNESMKPMPVNSIGELYIGGAGLARGYLNRPDLTESRFITNPFHKRGVNESSEKLYRTGDLVRWNKYGCLDFIGRVDHQIQIRGFRVELGEIENTILESTQIEEALVVAENEGVDKSLAAYIVPSRSVREDLGLVQISAKPVDGGSSVLGDSAVARRSFLEDLKKYLGASLPGYMVPTRFALLEKFPLTDNGKIDRDSLPADQLESNASAYVAPRNETELLLCEIWQEVLGVKRVGVKDNFFDLGGHSLLIVKLLNAVKQQFNIDIPIKVVFQFSDLESVSSYIDVFGIDKERQGSDRAEVEVETFKI